MVYYSIAAAAASAAKLLQSCPTLCNPIDGSPPGSPVPGILQARTLEWILFHCITRQNSISFKSSFYLLFSARPRASLVTLTVKSLPVIQETQVQSLGLDDPLEKGMATYSSILVWTIPGTEETGGLQSMESWNCRVRHD